MPESSSWRNKLSDLEKNVFRLSLLLWTSLPFPQSPSFIHVGYRYFSIMEVFCFLFFWVSNWFMFLKNKKKTHTQHSSNSISMYLIQTTDHYFTFFVQFFHFTVNKRYSRDKISFPRPSIWTSDMLIHLIWPLFKKYLSILLWVHGYFQNHSGLPLPRLLPLCFCPEARSTGRAYTAVISASLSWALSAPIFWAGDLNSSVPRKGNTFKNVLEATNLVYSFSIKSTPPLSTKQMNKWCFYFKMEKLLHNAD